MLQIERQKEEEEHLVLYLAGRLCIETVEIMRGVLLDGLAENRQVTLDGTALEEIDFYGLQLLCSAHRSSIVAQKVLNWQGGIPEPVAIAIAKVGFARSCGCSLCPEKVDCLWSCSSTSR